MARVSWFVRTDSKRPPQGKRMMKTKWRFLSAAIMAMGFVAGGARAGEIDVQSRRIGFEKPPFVVTAPGEVRLVHTTSFDNPQEFSRTRVFFLVRDKEKRVEEMFLVQIADRTSQEAGPITAPPLAPYAEKRMYAKETFKRKDIPVEWMVQAMTWNPEASSLQPIVKKGLTIPARWALQGQVLFLWQGEHAVLIRYSRDAGTFGLKVSEEGDRWNRDRLSGNEKKAYEAFLKGFRETLDSVQIKTP
jgi:hypothetical protein